MTHPTLIFDLDGTLVRCAEYYKAAIVAFGEATQERLGMPAAEAEELVRQIDICAIKASGSWMRDRWPRSFRGASLAADAMMGQAPNLTAAAEAAELAEQTFRAPYPLYPGARDVLLAMRAGGWRLVLYTKGDPEVQWRKVRLNALEPLFHAIEVTPKKDVSHLRRLCHEHNVDITTSWMIGDSRRDDIGPALALGLQTIQVMTSTWDYDRAEHTATFEVPAVEDLPRVLNSRWPQQVEGSAALAT